jgi:hypothetical protein
MSLHKPPTMTTEDITCPRVANYGDQPVDTRPNVEISNHGSTSCENRPAADPKPTPVYTKTKGN